MGNINRMVDIVVLLILTGLSVSDIRNKIINSDIKIASKGILELKD